MAKRRRSAHAALDELRQDLADERMKARDAEAVLEAAKAKVDGTGNAVADAYAFENDKLAAQRCKVLQSAEAAVLDLQHRVDAARLRVDRARQELDEFQHEHANDLLQEREPNARTVAAELSRSVAETLRLAKAYVAEGQAVDQLVAEVDGATARADGPSPEHPWERALRELQRAHQQVHELEPPLPRWHGLQQREQQDNAIRFDKLRRKKKLTDTEQHELQRLGQERAATPPVSSSDGRRRARA